ncbi:hypothetical protein EMWEY_00018160 [Eimeria maxima]|uniref:Uncharacterized protein n=1 Tax=Eimeria maxima TaxID=5804 RepID=U6M6Z7_EIMMA|nr:hypothetical protein EMWEY_00018160 [Eimeria maxima]CDJ58833.1 hypothetical protein EMWEY_00018160 [Eimeria maxima]
MGHVHLVHIALREHQTLFIALPAHISRQRVPPTRMIASNAKQAGSSQAEPPANKCRVGHMCPMGSSFEIPCRPVSFYNPKEGIASVLSCLPCPPGKYCGSAGLAEPSGKCAAGFYCSSGARYANEVLSGAGMWKLQMKVLKAYSIQNSVSRQVSVQSDTSAPQELVLRKNVPLENTAPPWGFQFTQENAKQGSSAMKASSAAKGVQLPSIMAKFVLQGTTAPRDLQSLFLAAEAHTSRRAVQHRASHVHKVRRRPLQQFSVSYEYKLSVVPVSVFAIV